MRIYIAADHAGFQLKEQLAPWLVQQGHEVIDCGAHEYDPADDYPDFIADAARAVAEDEEGWGIIIGGTGQGEMMTANKVPGIRAALFYGPVSPQAHVDIEGRESDDPYEIVKLARQHNDANMLALSARFMTFDQALKAVVLFLTTPFSDDERHIRRIEKIESL